MTSRQNPFANLSREQREMIEDAHNAGLSSEQIGVKFGLDFDDVRYYCEHFIVPPKSRFERLDEIIEDLESTCSTIKVKIDAGGANAMELQAYQRLMAEYRIAVAEFDSLKEPEDVVGEVIEKVLNPFVIDLTRVATEEMNKLQEELMKLSVEPRDARAISMDVFRRLTNSLQHTLDSSAQNLNNYFGVKKKKNKDDPFKERTIQ